MHAVPLILVLLAGPSTFLQRREARGQRTGPARVSNAGLLAGPPGNNAQGGNICTLSPGGSGSFSFRCSETEDAPIRGRLWHLRSLNGEIRPLTCGREAHLTAADFQKLDGLFSRVSQGCEHQPPRKTMQNITDLTCRRKRACLKNTRAGAPLRPQSVSRGSGQGVVFVQSLREGESSAAAALVTRWGGQLTLGSAAVSQSAAAYSAQEGGDTTNLQQLPALVDGRLVTAHL